MIYRMLLNPGSQNLSRFLKFKVYISFWNLYLIPFIWEFDRDYGKLKFYKISLIIPVAGLRSAPRTER